MERIFFDLLNFAKNFTLLGYNYYISIGIFALCMVAALVGLLDYYIDSKTSGFAVGLFVFYQASFIINVALCLAESVFAGKYFNSVASAYAFCFSQYAICLIFWLMLYKDKKTVAKNKKGSSDQQSSCGNDCTKCRIIDLYGDLLENLKQNGNSVTEQKIDSFGKTAKQCRAVLQDRRFENAKNDARSTTFESVPNEYVKAAPEAIKSTEITPEEIPPEEIKPEAVKSGIPDINVAYVCNLVNALSAKNIQPEEREKLQELNLKLKSLPSDAKGISELNGLLRFLLKKVAEYDISA